MFILPAKLSQCFFFKDVKAIFDSNLSFGIVFADNINTIGNLPSKINQDIKFIDTFSWNVYEHYEINGKRVLHQLGAFSESFDYLPIETKTIVERRNDFQGYHMIAMTEEYSPFININLDSAIYHDESLSYDVTNSVNGMFYDLFILMKEHLNFTATLHKRKDGKWGPTIVLPNGTIEVNGVPESLVSGFAEMIVARYL